jgi:hypothetical protein
MAYFCRLAINFIMSKFIFAFCFLLVILFISCRIQLIPSSTEQSYFLSPEISLVDRIEEIFKTDQSDISLYFEPGEYTINRQIYLNNIKNLRIFGNGAIIRMNDSTVVGNNFGMISFKNSSDIYIENITFDANRLHRSCKEVASHTFMIVSSNRISLFRVKALNNVVDGFIVYSETPEDSNTFCNDINFRNCVSSNSYRNALSIIEGRNITGTDCVFSDSHGISPEGGLVIEADIDRFDSNFRNLKFDNCEFLNNNGWGIIISQKSNPSNVNILNSRIKNSGVGGIWNCSVNTLVLNNEFLNNGSVAVRSVRYESRPIDTTVIVNNRFKGGKLGVDYVGMGGVIENNVFDSLGSYGVKLNGVTKDDTHAKISLNEFKNLSSTGISVNRFKNCLILENRFFNNSSVCTEIVSSNVTCKGNKFEKSNVCVKASYSNVKMKDNLFKNCSRDILKGENATFFYE